jgi:hypothetical protein
MPVKDEALVIGKDDGKNNNLSISVGKKKHYKIKLVK